MEFVDRQARRLQVDQEFLDSSNEDYDRRRLSSFMLHGDGGVGVKDNWTSVKDGYHEVGVLSANGCILLFGR